MKLAFSTLSCPAWSLHEVARAAAEYGYEGVELRLVDGELIDGAMPPSERRRIHAVFEQARLPIVAVDSSVRVAAEEDAAVALSQLRGFIEVAAAFESPVVRVFGGAWDASRTREGAIAQARHVLEEAVDDAAQHGVTIALETHDRFSSAALVAEVLDGLPSAAAALWDTGHPHRVGDGPDRVVALLDGRIAHVHVKDCRRGEDQDEWELTLLGEGEVPVQACIASLRGAGYDGWLSVEWEKKWHPELPEPSVALPQFANMLRSWT